MSIGVKGRGCSHLCTVQQHWVSIVCLLVTVLLQYSHGINLLVFQTGSGIPLLLSQSTAFQQINEIHVSTDYSAVMLWADRLPGIVQKSWSTFLLSLFQLQCYAYILVSLALFQFILVYIPNKAHFPANSDLLTTKSALTVLWNFIVQPMSEEAIRSTNIR